MAAGIIKAPIHFPKVKPDPAFPVIFILPSAQLMEEA